MDSTGALVWEGIKEIKMRETPLPKLEEGWVKLNSINAGICGSEISAYLGQNELRKPPSIMGHEFSGVIAEAGMGIKKDTIGKLVAVNPLVTCGVCRYCKSGNRQLCSERKIIGVNFPGGFAKQVLVPYLSCYEVNDPFLGSLAEPLATAIRGVRHSGASVGGSYLVIGAGTIGLFAVKILKVTGALKIIVSDTNINRLKWAGNWGATHLVNPLKENLSDVLKELAPEGIDGVIEAVGSDQTRQTAISAVRRGGKVVFLGLHEPESKVQINLVVRNEISILGSFAYTDDDFRTSVDLLNSGFIETGSGWVDIRPLESGDQAFREQAKGDAPFSKIVLRVQ